MPQTKITIDDAELRGAISRLLTATGDLKPAFDDIGQSALNFVQTYFDEEREPGGAPWQELAASTLRRKRKKNFRLKKLQQRGILFRSIRTAASSTGLAVGTDLIYARVHQFGADIQRQGGQRTLNFKVGRGGRSRFARASKANFSQTAQVGPYEIKIPARPYLNLGDDPVFVEDALRILQKHIEGAWNG